MTYVFARWDCVVGFEGRKIRLIRGDVWDASHPFVQARPEFFASAPERVYGDWARAEPEPEPVPQPEPEPEPEPGKDKDKSKDKDKPK